MFRYLFKRDTFFATIAVFVVMGLLALVPLNTHVLDPFKMALQDFDYNDLAFSKMRTAKHGPGDNDILVVNIDTAGRATLAAYLQQLQTLKPRAIGLDVIFDEARDPATDAALAQVLRQTPGLVSAYSLEEEGHHSVGRDYFYETGSVHKGFVNFVGEDTGVIRYFTPLVKDGGHNYIAFAAALSRVADPGAYRRLAERGHETEIINYTRRQGEFLVLDAAALFDPASASLFAGKIVLLGDVSDDPNNFIDRHFTPMNPRMVGKSWPDMSGVFVHANILRMILDGDYINRVPSWVNWLVAVLLCWLMSALFIRFYLDKHLWFHLAAKTAQLLFAILFVYLGLLFFARLQLKINLSLTLVAVILVVDVLYFYEALSVWLHRKWGYKTIFYREHH
ncbi:CHASE2 domain-containing protein [Flaviaesturariibacter aridisoli]|uniref:CHASE2 domain-containing protein n=1 Tax=Flaviaesturariibacter aridisoli TaxID=2545761 RepID=A0A4R4E1D6_9BACT|nr:CHASE2 domain-containing protein [Flaviaesturariibacter aridisoli]TCZ73159.1 CHASE2 domain-containing protein [Flaviaesturariibacter aridisoli]